MAPKTTLTLLLLSSLAALGATNPITSAETSTLDKRTTGVWVDVYKAGDCKSGWETDPTSGWVWAGQCKNIESFTYGAKAGYNGDLWPDCILKFWENADCHGHATTHHIEDTIHWTNGYPSGNYECIATANKGDEFYLTNGAASVELIC
ncbi:hypothetical protein BJX99DRAFT_258942 [Aspergillus californicus]